MYKSILLSEAEMKRLDDGQDWYNPGDEVYLGGYLPDEKENPAFDLSVNGYVHDSWVYWGNMPAWLQKRLKEA